MILPDLAAGPRTPTPAATGAGRVAAKDDPEKGRVAASDAPADEAASDETRDKDAEKDFEAVLGEAKTDAAPALPATPPVTDPAVATPALPATQPPAAPVPEIVAEFTVTIAPQATPATPAGPRRATAPDASEAARVPEGMVPTEGEAFEAPAATAPATVETAAAPAQTLPVARPAPAEVAQGDAPEPSTRAEPEADAPARDAADAVSTVDAAPDTDPAPAKPREIALTPSAVAAPEWRLAAQAVSHARELPAAVHAAPREVTQQITLAVSTATSGSVEIRLDPPELGRVHIHLTPTEQGGLQATVLAERPETHDFLRRHAETLTKDLNAAGYDAVSLEFATGGQNAPTGGERWPEARSFGFGGAELAAAPPMAPAEPTRKVSSGSLDIRL